MAKSSKKSANMNQEIIPAAVETTPAPAPVANEQAPAPRPHLIVAKRTVNDRWYVYFQGVHPDENVGCGCKTAKSAIRYMLLLKRRYGAVISQNIYDRLQYEAAKEA